MRFSPTAPLLAAAACAVLLAGCGGSGGGAPTAPGATTPAAATPPATTTAGPGERPQSGVGRGLIVGIGDQGAGFFTAPLFTALHLNHARLIVSYDTMAVGFERQLVDVWLGAARKAGVEPFVTFGHSRVHPTHLPTVAEFRAAFIAFRKAHPEVHVYAAWNEVNHSSQPTAKDPARAAAFYNVVRAGCSGCTVLAGDVLDQAGVVSYLRRYRRHLDGNPRLWGLHNYSDTNRFRKTGTRDVLAEVPGDLWLTETGGVARFGRAFPYDEARQARAMRYALKLARSEPRIKRLYLYNWTGAKPGDRFDAGLTTAAGAPRPAYTALREALRKGN